MNFDYEDSDDDNSLNSYSFEWYFRRYGNSKLTGYDFKVGPKIGEGRFGIVFQAVEVTTQQPFAIKTFNEKEIVCNNLRSLILKEISIQERQNHRYIMPLYDYFIHEDWVYMVFPLAKSSLFDLMRASKYKRLKEVKAAKYATQIGYGLCYLHDQGVIHRDLKPENILLDYEDNAVISDFGEAVLFRGEPFTEFCGTYEYMAPEVLKTEPYDFKADVWSYAATCFSMMVGRSPFESKRRPQVIDKIRNCRVNYPSHMSKDAKEFLHGLFKLSPHERLPLHDALCHTWILKNIVLA